MRTLKLLIFAAALLFGASDCSARPWLAYPAPAYGYGYYAPSYYGYPGYYSGWNYAAPYSSYYSPYSAYYPSYGYYGW